MNNKIISSSTVPPDGPTAEAAQGAGRGQEGGGRYEERHQGAGAGAEGPGSHAAGPGTKDCGEWHTCKQCLILFGIESTSCTLRSEHLLLWHMSGSCFLCVLPDFLLRPSVGDGDKDSRMVSVCACCFNSGQRDID